MRNELVKIIMDIHQANTKEQIRTDDIDFLLYNGRSSEILFIFIKDQVKPKYIAKISRYKTIKADIKNGSEILKRTSYCSWVNSRFNTVSFFNNCRLLL